MLGALEIMAHFDPLMWVIENPATGLLKTRPFMERLRYLLRTVDQHALEAEEIASAATAQLADRLSIPD